MNTPRTSIRRILALLVVLVMCAPLASAKEEPAKKKGRKVQAVRPPAGKKLTAAYEAIKLEDYATATAEMDALKRKSSTNDHEKALMWQTYGHIQSSQENFKQAAESFKKALALDAMPEAQQRSAMYNLAQLYLATENYTKAIATLNTWFKTAVDPPPQAYYMLAIAYFQNEQLDKALKPATKALTMVDKPKESWLQLVLSLQFERKAYPEVLEVLHTLLEMYPKKTYYKQLSGVYGELGQEKDALAAMELAYMQGFLVKDRELRTLARLYMYHQIPIRAAKVIQKGFDDGLIEQDAKSWRLLADAQLNAREYEDGVEPLAQAAKLSEEGDLYIRLGQVHMEKENWNEARKALQSAIDLGGLADEGNAYLLLGISNASAKRPESARKAFARAAKSPKTEKSARAWIRHLDHEKEVAASQAALNPG